MTSPRRLIASVAVLACVLLPSPAWALSIGQHDDFEDGTTAGWVVALLAVPHPAPPANEPTGGPAGTGDGFLRLTAVGGGGAGSRLSVINVRQWTGDYIAAGIPGIRMDLNNFGPTDLSLRLLFSDAGVGLLPQNLAFSTTPFRLPAGSGWRSAFFPLAPADLTAGLGSVTAALHNTTEFRLYHGIAPQFPGEVVTGALGVDNITPTPEPTSAILLGSGLLALYSWKTWRGRKLRA